MKFNKLLRCSVLSFIVVCGLLTGCRNNLVNEWENYTGDTGVYYYDPDETTVPGFTSEIPTEKDEELDEYGIPEYWADELQNVVTETQRVMSGVEEERTAFLWYSDAHWSYSANRSTALLKYLQDYTNIQFVNFGGDIVSNNKAVEYSEIVSGLNEWREATLSLSNHHSVVGNHDDDIAELESRDDLYAFLLEKEVNKESNPNNRFCYYVDNSKEKTRYIYLDTGFESTTASDLRFLVNTLNSTQKDWHIVLVSHIWFVYNETTTPTVGKVPDNVIRIFDIIDEYNARSTGSVHLSENVDYDFSNALATVEFCIGGHTHVDYDFCTDGGIPVILNETDSYHLRGGDKGLDKTDEASVSVIVADYSQQIVHIIRAGRGVSRTVSLSQTNNG